MVRDVELPIVFTNQLILSPGVWNNLDIRSSSIESSVNNTKWDSKSTAIIYSHTPEAEKWVGNLRNPNLQNGSLYGDLELWDKDLAIKLKFGKAPLGISARFGYSEQESNVPIDMFYENFSIVYKPACAPAMINFENKKSDDNKLHTEILCNNTINTAEFEEEVTNESSKGSSSEGSVNQKIKGLSEEEEASESDLMSAERGLSSKKTMESKENKIEENLETSEEESKESTEESKEESAELSALKGELKAVIARVAELEEAAKESTEEKASEEESKESSEETESAAESTEKASEEESKESTGEKSSEMAEAAKELIEAAKELKKAAPRTTAEFGKDRIDNYEATTDRLVKDLTI